MNNHTPYRHVAGSSPGVALLPGVQLQRFSVNEHQRMDKKGLGLIRTPQ